MDHIPWGPGWILGRQVKRGGSQADCSVHFGWSIRDGCNSDAVILVGLQGSLVVKGNFGTPALNSF